MGRRFALLVGLLLLAACAPTVVPYDPALGTPRLEGGFLYASDGRALPVRRWRPEGQIRAVIIGVHGFNDYGASFAMPAAWWAERGIVTYAFDQRGFGETGDRGLWHHRDGMAADFGDAVAAASARHPGLPVFAVGVSMGGAVVLAALGAEGGAAAGLEGAVLVAPAVWGWSKLNPFYKAVLWLSAHVAPGQKVSGRGLGIKPSDNRDMLLALGRDPLVIKETRLDTIYGLVGLMEAADRSAPGVTTPLLVLYGARDEIIPPDAIADMAGDLAPGHRVARYAGGYHMLLRDLQAEVVWRDILAWIEDRLAPLPSGEEVKTPKQALEPYPGG